MPRLGPRIIRFMIRQIMRAYPEIPPEKGERLGEILKKIDTLMDTDPEFKRQIDKRSNELLDWIDKYPGGETEA